MAIAWVISIVAALAVGTAFGYYMDWVKKQLNSIKESIKEKADAKKPDVRKSFLLDPEDVKQRTLQEHEEMMRQINQ